MIDVEHRVRFQMRNIVLAEYEPKATCLIYSPDPNDDGTGLLGGIRVHQDDDGDIVAECFALDFERDSVSRSLIAPLWRKCANSLAESAGFANGLDRIEWWTTAYGKIGRDGCARYDPVWWRSAPAAPSFLSMTETFTGTWASIEPKPYGAVLRIQPDDAPLTDPPVLYAVRWLVADDKTRELERIAVALRAVGRLDPETGWRDAIERYGGPYAALETLIGERSTFSRQTVTDTRGRTWIVITPTWKD